MRQRYRVVALAILGAALMALPLESARAEPEDRAAKQKKRSSKTTVSYQGVDAATVRVFAIGTVGASSLKLKNGKDLRLAELEAGHGTGFMVGDDGLLLTAQHVVDGATNVVVRLPGDQGFTPARVVVTSKQSDVAVLSIEKKMPAITLLKEQALPVRMTVFALGYPLDATRTHAQSSRGIVSGAMKDGTVQLDISVNPGNSGGPLVDEANRVVGMVIARGDVASGVQGMGYAVPLDKLKQALLIARQRVDELPERFPRGAKRRAAVVDALIQRGALHVLEDRKDLNSRISQEQLGEDLEDFTDSIRDADLLAFVSGNLWNAHLILKYGDVRRIGDAKLSAAAKRNLVNELRERSLKLAWRANRQDSDIGERSPFIRFAMQFFPKRNARANSSSPPTRRRLRNYDDPSLRVERSKPAPLLANGDEFGARALLALRIRDDRDGAGTGYGISAFMRRQLSLSSNKKTQTFLQVGPSYGTASWSKTSADERFTHRFFALEAGLMFRFWQHSGNHLQLGLFWAPGHYKSQVGRESSPEMAAFASASEFIVQHGRASVAITFGNLELSIGLRAFVGPTIWIEPLAFSVSF